MSTVPVFSPDGTLGDIPQDQLMAAVKAGAKPGVHVTSPDGKPGIIPADRTADAVKAGAKIVLVENQPIQHPGFWASMGADLKGMIPGSWSEAAAMGGKGALRASTMGASDLPAMAKAVQSRLHAGNSIPYAVGAAEAEGLGANVRGMEQSAQEGDVAGVAGHAATVPTTIAAGFGLAKAGAPLAEAAGAGARRALLLGRTPEEAYQSALKPSTAMPAVKRAALVQTGLQEGIPVSKSGLQTIADRIDDLNHAISGKIQQGAGAGQTVEPGKVAARLNDTITKFANQVTPENDLRSIADVRNEFLRNRPSPIPVDEAQALKQGTYRVLAGKFGEQGSAAVEAQKALARGLKEELSAQIPEIKDLNAQEGRLLDLQPVLEKALNRIGNHQLVGIGTPITTGVTKAVTGSTKVAAVAGLMKAVLDDPLVKSRLAISLSKGAKIPPATAYQRVNAYAASLGVASENKEAPQEP